MLSPYLYNIYTQDIIDIIYSMNVGLSIIIPFADDLFEFCDRSSIPSVCQSTDVGLRQVVYIVSQPRQWPSPRLAMRYWGGLHQ